MSALHKIGIRTLTDVDKALEALFGFGFVFMRSRRFNSLEQVKDEYSDLERGNWAWIIHGYDEECQMVFGVSSAFDYTLKRFIPISLDAFIEEKCCDPYGWEEVKKIRDISIPANDQGKPIELVKFNPWWC